MSEAVATPAASRAAWKWMTLADVGKVITGNTPPTADAENYGDAIPFVKPTELVDRGIRSAPSGLAPQAMGKARVVPAGAVLVSCIGNLGKTGIAKVPVAFNQQINAVVFNENVIPEFGFYYAQTLKPWLYGESSATTIPIVNKGKFQQARFPLAPLDEQREIVAELEKQFSRLDEAVANLQRVKANLKRYKASVLKAAVEGRLVETEDDWTRAKLGDIALSVRNGYSSKPDADSGTRIFRISAVRPMELTVDDVRYLSGAPADYGTFLTEEGDVLFTRYNGSRDYVGVCAQVPTGLPPTVYPDKLIRVRVPTDQLLPAFLVISASTGEGREFIESMIRTTAGQSGVSGSDIKAIPLSIPTMAEQTRIVAEVDRHLSIIREVEAEVDANLQRAQALRQATLATAFGLNSTP